MDGGQRIDGEPEMIPRLKLKAEKPADTRPPLVRIIEACNVGGQEAIDRAGLSRQQFIVLAHRAGILRWSVRMRGRAIQIRRQLEALTEA